MIPDSEHTHMGLWPYLLTKYEAHGSYIKTCLHTHSRGVPRNVHADGERGQRKMMNFHFSLLHCGVLYLCLRE